MPSHALSHAPLAVLLLGGLSAAALLAASAADFGDPRQAARARAAQAVKARGSELQLAWAQMRSDPSAPRGAGQRYTVAPSATLRLAAALPEQATLEDAGPTADSLVTVYFEMGHAALARGEAALALEALEEGLGRADTATQGYASGLYAAMRAASSLGETDTVMQLRQRLGETEADALVEQTSVHLLAQMIEPAAPDVAHRLLTAGRVHLPAPQDHAAVAGAQFDFHFDPWWQAVQKRLEAQDPSLDWKAAFHQEVRSTEAVRALIPPQPSTASELWSFAPSGPGVLACRRSEGAIEVAAMDEAALLDALQSVDASANLNVQLSRSASTSPSARTLDGSPYQYLVTHKDPEASARPELRRLRMLRLGLAGLGALVLLAATLSSRAMARARRLAELRSTFVASVSHDLRTPTQAILLLAETLEQELVTGPEKRQHYHRQIRREAQRLRRLVEDLLDGARIDRGGGARIERKTLDSEPFFRELTAAMEERAGAAEARLNVIIGALPETLHVDPDGVHRAVWNLFENALIHGHTPDQPAHVEVHVSVDDGVLHVRVEDEGPGIPARYHGTVFDPFQRLRNHRPADGIEHDTGTGLGLAIVRALAQAHGGAAAVEPSDRGARFTLTFPLDGPGSEEAA